MGVVCGEMIATREVPKLGRGGAMKCGECGECGGVITTWAVTKGFQVMYRVRCRLL